MKIEAQTHTVIPAKAGIHWYDGKGTPFSFSYVA